MVDLGLRHASGLTAANAPASAPQLFCLHPSGGIVFCYQPLARKLQNRARTFGVMHRGFSEPHAGPEAWHQMIADYSQEIVSAQPEGPYYLMGWSLGGAIALDIAATLVAQAEAPLPFIRSSEGRPSHLACAPVAMIKVSAKYCVPLSPVRRIGRLFRSTAEI